MSSLAEYNYDGWALNPGPPSEEDRLSLSDECTDGDCIHCGEGSLACECECHTQIHRAELEKL